MQEDSLLIIIILSDQHRRISFVHLRGHIPVQVWTNSAFDGSKKLRKYRLLALLAPAVIMAGSIVCMYYARFTSSSISKAVLICLIGAASYYHLKYLIIPDVEDGILRSVRSFNYLALLYTVLCISIIALEEQAVSESVLLVLYILTCITTLCIVPVLKRGVKKWSI